MNSSLQTFSDVLTIENLDLVSDDYLKLVIYETMRIEPAVPLSSSFCLTENLEIGGI